MSRSLSSAERTQADLTPYSIIYDLRDQRKGWYVDCACGRSQRGSFGPAHPPERIIAKFEQFGWLLRRGHPPVCPACNRTHTTMPVASPTPKIAVPAKLTPIGPDPKIARKIFAALDEHFDDVARLYHGAWSDEAVAKSLDVSTEIVTRIRREAYGELAEDPALAKLSDDMALVRMELDDAVGKIVKTFGDKLSALESELYKLRNTKRAA